MASGLDRNTAEFILNQGWVKFLVHAAGRLDIQQRYNDETGLLARYPDQPVGGANDNSSVDGSMSPKRAATLFAYWVTLRYWGAGPGPGADFMALAREAFPQQAAEMDAGWDRRLEAVK